MERAVSFDHFSKFSSMEKSQIQIHFMYQNCTDKEFLLWEEPLIGNSELEKFKLVSEGTPTDVAIKFKEPARLQRTPLMITTSHHIWRFCRSERDAFENRTFIYQFGHVFRPGDASSFQGDSCKCSYIARTVETSLITLVGQSQQALAVHQLHQTFEIATTSTVQAITRTDLLLQDAKNFMSTLVTAPIGNYLMLPSNTLQGTTTQDEAAAADSRMSSAATVQDLQSAAAAPQLSITTPLPSTDPAVPWQNEQDGRLIRDCRINFYFRRRSR